MTSANPWLNFALTVAIVSIIYYTVIAWKFYRNDIKQVISRKRQKTLPFSDNQPNGFKDPGSTEQVVGEKEQQQEMPLWQNKELLEKVQGLLAHLTDEIRQAHQKNYTKQDLVQMLQMILKEYPVLKDTPFQLTVDGRIDSECAKYGLIYLTQSDKNQVWGTM